MIHAVCTVRLHRLRAKGLRIHPRNLQKSGIDLLGAPDNLLRLHNPHIVTNRCAADIRVYNIVS
ncbi:hypothetical protein D3C71_2239860 [compost metagenome]